MGVRRWWPRWKDALILVQPASLGTGAWIRDHHNLLLTGPTGIGKSWLASAFVESGCRLGLTAIYVRALRLLHDLVVSRGDGSYARLLVRFAKLDLLAIDEWLVSPLTDAERRDLLEVIEDRSERRSTLIASQLPPTAWHAAIGEPTIADAICDHLIHRAHKSDAEGTDDVRSRDTTWEGEAMTATAIGECTRSIPSSIVVYRAARTVELLARHRNRVAIARGSCPSCGKPTARVPTSSLHAHRTRARRLHRRTSPQASEKDETRIRCAISE